MDEDELDEWNPDELLEDGLNQDEDDPLLPLLPLLLVLLPPPPSKPPMAEKIPPQKLKSTKMRMTATITRKTQLGPFF